MAESIINKLPQSAINNFTTKTNTPVVKLKKQAKVYADVDISQLNLMLVGPSQSGKTYFLIGLLLLGLKIFVFTTDNGGNGLMSVRNGLRKLGKPELEKNLVFLELDTYDEVQEFLEKPTTFFPDIYTFGFDVLFWDGFANYHHYHLNEKVASMTPTRSNVSDAREAGLQFEQTDWGMIKQGTLKPLDRFFRLHNKIDGTVWHKIVTCLPKSVQKKGGDGTFMEVPVPNLSGAASVMMNAAFDLIILTSAKKTAKGDIVYQYTTSTDGLNCCKNRGFDVPSDMEADSGKLWEMLTKQYGITQGKKDKSLIEG